MRSLFKMGTPRGLQQFQMDPEAVVSSLYLACLAALRPWKLAVPFTAPPNELCDALVPGTQPALAA